MAPLSYVMHNAHRQRMADKAHWVYVAGSSWWTKIGVSRDPASRGYPIVKAYKIGPSALDVEQSIHALLEGLEWGGGSSEMYDIPPDEAVIFVDAIVADFMKTKLAMKTATHILPSLDLRAPLSLRPPGLPKIPVRAQKLMRVRP